MQSDSLTSWQELYKTATENERAKMESFMRWSIEEQERKELELYKKYPLMLDGLTVPKLRDVAYSCFEELGQWFYDNFPELREKQDALWCLNEFINADDKDVSERDLRGVIGAICVAWGVSLFPDSVETKQAVKQRLEGNK